jgi:hypothetical protein
LKAAREVFLNEYPNPERKGCPGAETIRAIVFGRLRGAEADQWWDHFSRCSPCTRELAGFRQEAVRAKRVRTLGLVAAAGILVAIVGWAALSGFGPRSRGVGTIAWVEGWRPASIDLRGHEALRGGEPGPTLPPIVLPRGKLVLTIDLPVGSEPRNYDVDLQQPNGQLIARANGTANLVNGLTVLKIRIDTRKAIAGGCSLMVRRLGQSWARYSTILK